MKERDSWQRKNCKPRGGPRSLRPFKRRLSTFSAISGKKEGLRRRATPPFGDRVCSERMARHVHRDKDGMCLDARGYSRVAEVFTKAARRKVLAVIRGTASTQAELTAVAGGRDHIDATAAEAAAEVSMVSGDRKLSSAIRPIRYKRPRCPKVSCNSTSPYARPAHRA